MKARAAWRHPSRLGEVDKIGLVSQIAKQAFVGRLLSDLWFQRLCGFPFCDLSIRDFLCAGDDVLLAGAGTLCFCLGLVQLLHHQIVTVVFSGYSIIRPDHQSAKNS